MHAWHLVKRFAESWSRRPPAVVDLEWVASVLSADELELWRRHRLADQRHTVRVARSFVACRPSASGAEIAGALLHDVGKVQVGLGIPGRVLARLIGPRSAPLRAYLDHENVGAEMLRVGGSDPVTVALARGEGPAAGDLRAADDY